MKKYNEHYFIIAFDSEVYVKGDVVYNGKDYVVIVSTGKAWWRKILRKLGFNVLKTNECKVKLKDFTDTEDLVKAFANPRLGDKLYEWTFKLKGK